MGLTPPSEIGQHCCLALHYSHAMRVSETISLQDILESGVDTIDNIQTNAPGPDGKLPLTSEMLLNWASGDIFGLSQDAGMGWTQRVSDPEHLRRNPCR
jgi:hypothetical protein